MKLTTKLDSVAGERCVIIYGDGRPLMTVWESALISVRRKGVIDDFLFLAGAPVNEGEISNLMLTIKALGGGYLELAAAMETYLDQKFNGKEGS